MNPPARLADNAAAPSPVPARRFSSAIIIVAGGTGARMGTDIPKQFLPVAGKPLLMHTIEQFFRFDGTLSTLVVLPAGRIEEWRRLCREYRFSREHTTVCGGDTRFQSVKNALHVIPPVDFIAVHDGVRPFVPASLIARCFEVAAQHGSAAPVVPVIDSLRKKAGENSYPVPREALYAVQTPQVFRADWLKSAYAQASAHSAFTDDASVVEAAGYPVTLTEGCRENLKITEPVDRQIAEALGRFLL